MNSRKRFEWKFKSRRLSLGEKTLIAGTLTIAPEHQPGGRDPMDPDRAFALAAEMEESGADLLLIGADALMAGVRRVSEEEELRRLVPCLKRLRDRIGVPVGVVTEKSAVATRAFEYGLEIVFDPTGLTVDPALPKLIAQHDAGLIVGHMRGNPESWTKLPPSKDTAAVLGADLDAALGRARRDRINPQSLVVDPGMGLGKRREQDLEILAVLPRLQRLEVPVAMGAGNLPSGPALFAAVLAGAHIVRCVDVPAMRAALEVADGVLSEIARIADREADSAGSSASPSARRPLDESRTRTPGTPDPRDRRPDGVPGKFPDVRRDPRSPR